MKRYCLLLLGFCSFLLAMLQVVQVSGKNIQPQVQSTRNNTLLSAYSVQFGSELELGGTTHVNPLGHTYRISNGFACLPFLNAAITGKLIFYKSAITTKAAVSFKKYLLHIYPTHNFW